MKLRIEKADNAERLSVIAVKKSVDLALVDFDVKPEYTDEKDDSLTLELKDASKETREAIIIALEDLSWWEDMRFKVLE